MVTNQATKGLLQPQLVFASGTLANSAINFSNGNESMGFANLIWAIAFVSLDAIFKNGGMYQKYFSGDNTHKAAIPEPPDVGEP